MHRTADERIVAAPGAPAPQYPLNRVLHVLADRQAFCLHLKQTREHAGLTLEAIAESTKIGVSLLRGLERGDVSRWPKGIFRRSFIREYAAAIGLPAEPTVKEFTRLFPEDDGRPVERGDLAFPDGLSDLRLTLASDRGWLAPTRARTLAALVDVCVVLAIAGLTAWLLPASFWTMMAAVALIYYSAATLSTGTTPASFWMTSRMRIRWRGARPTGQPAAEGPRLVFRRPESSSLMSAPPDTDREASSPPQNLRAASN